MIKSRVLNTSTVLVLKNPNFRHIDQMWLVENGVCDREDFSAQNTIFVPDLIQITTEEYQLQCIANRITLTLAFPKETDLPLGPKRLAPFLNEGEHLNPEAIGCNVSAWIEPPIDAFPAINKKLLANASCPAAPFFTDENSRYGSYFSVDHDDFRFRLDMKPIRVPEHGEAREVIGLEFNFHKGLSKPYSRNEAKAVLDKWPSCWGHASAILNAMVNEAEGSDV